MDPKKDLHIKAPILYVWLRNIVFVLAYYSLGYLSYLVLYASKYSGFVLWPVTGLALAYVLVFGLRNYYLVFLSSLVLYITLFYFHQYQTLSSSITLASILAFGNTAEVTLGFLILRRYSTTEEMFSSISRVVYFIIAVLFISLISAATYGVRIYAEVEVPIWMLLPKVYSWYANGVIATMVYTPFFISFLVKRFRSYDRIRLREAIILAIISSVLVLSTGVGPTSEFVPDNIVFVVFLIVLIISTRHGLRTISAMVVLVSLLMFYVSSMGYGFNRTGATQLGIAGMQLIISMLAAGALIMFSSITERNRAWMKVNNERNRLEDHVVSRTNELIELNKLLKAEVLARKNAEKIMKESEEMFRHIYDQSPVGMLILDSRGSVKNANKAYLEMSGLKKSELVNYSFFLDHNFIEVEQLAFKQDKVFSKETQYTFGNQTVGKNKRWVNISSVPIESNDGNRMTILLYIDTQEEKEVLTQLKKSNSLLLDTQKLAKIGSWEYFIETDKITWTQECYKLFGINETEEPSVEVLVSSLTTDTVPLLDFFKNRKFGSVPVWNELHLRVQKKNGATTPVRFIYEIETKDGNFHKVFGIVQDISERKAYENMLMEYAARQKVIVDSIPFGFAFIKNERFEQQNKGTVDIFKFTELLVSKSKFYDLFTSLRNYNEFERESTKKIATGEVYIGNWEMRRIDKTKFWCKLIGKAIFAEKPEAGVVWIFEDITEQLYTNESLLLAKEKAESANRAKNEFLANMGHEIRTPMNAIVGFSEILSKKLQHISSVAEYTSGIVEAGGKLMLLINDILDLSRLETNRLKLNTTETNLRDILADIARGFQTQANQKGLAFSVDVNKNVPEILNIDGQRVKQVIFNLVENAIKFTPKGAVTISVMNLIDYPEMDTANILIEVRDTGIGIAKRNQQQIFEPFTQQDGSLSRKFGGTGLGLAISRKLLEIMHGTIAVESKPDQGSSFRVFINNIPVLKNVQTVEQVSLFEHPVNLDAVKVLVVDDMRSNRMVIVGFLEDMGLELKQVGTAKDAMVLAKEWNPALILTDIRLPDTSGDVFAKSIKSNQKLRHIKIVALTGLENKDEVGEKQQFFDDWLSKPINKKQLQLTIRKMFANKKQDNAAVTAVAVKLPEGEKEIKQALGLLNRKVAPLYEQLQFSIDMDSVRAFSECLLLVNKEIKIDQFNQIAQQLKIAAEAFSIEKILNLLNEYGVLKNDIEKRLQ